MVVIWRGGVVWCWTDGDVERRVVEEVGWYLARISCRVVIDLPLTKRWNARSALELDEKVMMSE